jgi:hypothetical protein
MVTDGDAAGKLKKEEIVEFPNTSVATLVGRRMPEIDVEIEQWVVVVHRDKVGNVEMRVFQ